MKLISMVDFVIDRDNHELNENLIKCIFNYAKFLKQPLELWMFVPCDEDGNVLEEPKDYEDIILQGSRIYHYDCISGCRSYLEAKERCLFEGFFNTTESPQYKMYIENGMQAVFYIAINSSTLKNIFGTKVIEDLIKGTPVQLTKTAIKKITL